MAFLKLKRQPFAFDFCRKKTDRSFVRTIYMKFLNFLMRKGYKNKYINLFYNLFRIHKKKFRQLLFWKHKTKKLSIFKTKKVLKKVKILTFQRLFSIVALKITCCLELKSKKLKRKQIVKPMTMSPWRGFRLGINLFLKNCKTNANTLTRFKSREKRQLYSILTELWDTYHNFSETSKNILDFINVVMENTANYRYPRFFNTRPERRFLFLKRIKKKKTNSKLKILFDRYTLLMKTRSLIKKKKNNKEKKAFLFINDIEKKKNLFLNINGKEFLTENAANFIVDLIVENKIKNK